MGENGETAWENAEGAGRDAEDAERIMGLKPAAGLMARRFHSVQAPWSLDP